MKRSKPSIALLITCFVLYGSLQAQKKITPPGNAIPPVSAPAVAPPATGGNGGTGISNIVLPDVDNSLIPPSPEAASLGKFGVFPVTLYTGMPQVSIPITEIKTAKLSLPIYLEYNYNGYRPSEQATWAGLGWSLNAGGVITRVVKGLPDDFGLAGSSWHHWQDFASITDLAAQPNGEFMTAVGNRWIDTEPDIYSFHFNGHSGKFIVVGSRIYTFPKQDLTITNDGAGGFEIRTEDGTTYLFAETEMTYGFKTSLPGTAGNNYNSSWFLSEISSADGADNINFNYSATHVNLQSNYAEAMVTVFGQQGCPDPSINVTSSQSQPYIASKQLYSITANNEAVYFVSDTNAAIYNNEGAVTYKLDEIDVYNTISNTKIKRVQLVHGFFDGLSYVDARGGFYGTQGHNHLRLDSVNIWGYYNTGTGQPDSLLEPYSLQYNNPNGNYPASTRGIDNYGYYNGKDSNRTLFDSGYLPTEANCNYQYPPGDRGVYPQFTANGILTQITFPTGGYSVFTYENNQVLNRGAGLTKPGPGMRIKSIASYDNINYSGPALLKTYTYSPGYVLSMAFGNGQYYTQYLVPDPMGTATNSGNTETITTNFSSPMAALLGDQFYYPTVTEMDDANGQNGYTIYQFLSDETDALGVYLSKKTVYKGSMSGATPSFPIKIESYTYATGPSISFAGFTFTVSEVDQPQSGTPFIQYSQLDTVQRLTVYSPNQSYVLNSTCQSLIATDDTTFDMNGQNPVAIHTAYYYDNPEYLHYSREVITDSKGQMQTTQYKFPPDYALTSCITYSAMDSIYQSLRNTISATYLQGMKTRDSLAESLLHDGDIWGAIATNPVLNQPALRVLESYPCENTYYANSQFLFNNLKSNLYSYENCRIAAVGSANTDAGNAILLMQLFRTLKPVETIGSVTRNGAEYLTVGVKTDYTAVDLQGVLCGGTPKLLYQTVVPAGTQVLKSTFLANPNTYYQPRVTLTHDTLNNNLVEQYKTNNTHEIMLWGYHSVYPVAKIIGSNYATVSALITQANLVNPGSDQQLRTYLNTTLRLGLPGAMVTTYTYAPLIGVTSETNPNGYTTYFEYDALGRLIDSKDKDGNVVKSYQYHYQNQ